LCVVRHKNENRTLLTYLKQKVLNKATVVIKKYMHEIYEI